MRMFYDTENREYIDDNYLAFVFDELKKDDPETYNYSFAQYVNNCTSKNGTLVEITDKNHRVWKVRPTE